MLLTKEYNRQRAVEYARRWALDRNPLFVDFTGQGGNCTNFVSQCVYAGSCVMNFTRDFGWYYISSDDRAPAWTGVEFFYDFMTGAVQFRDKQNDEGPFGSEVSEREVEIGDVIQLADMTGDFYHTLIISEITANDILVCAHSDDSLDRPLSTYNYSSLRFIHIEGVGIDAGDDSCFDNLIEGESIF
ncbi:MAG: amidase domain-containing protein [Clostridia bacterium]|nr:amidase domain-containing protein [Clostridia bacterium]